MGSLQGRDRGMTKSSRIRFVLAVFVLVGSCLAVGVLPAAADPPEPDHGLNASDFYPLWSHDEDSNVSSNATAIRALANGTDISYSEPPQQVQQWNQQDLEEFPNTGRQTSVYPEGTDTTSSERGWITDAYTRLFAIQPSTRVFVSESRQPLYVPSEGSILATTDFRVDLPADDVTGGVRVFYELTGAEIESIRAISGARTIGTTAPSQTVQINYSDLQSGPHAVGVEARIEIDVTKTVKTEVCSVDEDGNEDCHWETDTEVIDESVTAEDTRLVEQYSLLSTGYVTQYPDGDMGVVTKQNHPWAGLSLPGNDSANGVWEFYSGRETDWDSLTKTTPEGAETVSSPAQPLQVYAYPSTSQAELETSEGGFSQPDGELLQTRGEQRTVPKLPTSVNVDTANESYNVSSQLAVRHEEYAPDEVEVQGLVAGTSRELTPSFYTTVETRGTSLEAGVINSTSSTLRVRVELTDESGEPVMTAGYDGRVIVEGTPIETNAAGTAIVTIERTEKRLSARYEPAPFWKRNPAYTSSTAVFYPTSSLGGDMWLLFSLILSSLILWIPVYMADKMLDLDIWPPWEGIW